MNAGMREFELVADCCRFPMPPDAAFETRWEKFEIDWRRVARIARRHRVEALVWNRLRTTNIVFPQEACQSLRSAAERTARDNLKAVRQSTQLKDAFDAAGVPLLFFKGVTLAMLAYGTLSLKAARDIDVLVPGDQIEAAATILSTAGYMCISPATDDIRRVCDWHGFDKESVWMHPSGGKLVELHTRLVNNPMLLPLIGLTAPRPVLVQGGVSLATLPPDELFAYLCVHGASSGSHRLKWVADIAALLTPLAPPEIERLYRTSLALGAGRAPAIALLLCKRLLKLGLPDSLSRELRGQWIARAMAEATLRKMTGRYIEREIHTFAFGTLTTQLTLPFMLPGFRFAISEMRRLSTRPYDRFELESDGQQRSLDRVRLLTRKLAQPLARRRTRCEFH